jgi:hypothetical protein
MLPAVPSDGFQSGQDWWLPCRKKKATSVPWQYFLFVSTSYGETNARGQDNVNNLSGAGTLFQAQRRFFRR